MVSNIQQIAHSIKSLDPCFLVQPKWQSLTRNLTPPATIPEFTPISLRIKLCSFLAQLSELVLSFKALSCVAHGHPPACQADQKDEVLRLLNQTMSMHEAIQVWYSTELEPYAVALSQVSSEKDFQGANTQMDTAVGHRNILFVVLDCVTNSALLNIERLISLLNQALREMAVMCVPLPTDCGLFKADNNIISVNERRQRINSSFEFVKRESPLSAKPLEFGLHRIALVGNIF
jgi:hypothetical protein